jgi:hypothetical protein
LIPMNDKTKTNDDADDTTTNGAFEVNSVVDTMAFVKALRCVSEHYKQKPDATEDDLDDDDDEESFSTDDGAILPSNDTETRSNEDDPESDGVIVKEEAGQDDDDLPYAPKKRICLPRRMNGFQ